MTISFFLGLVVGITLIGAFFLVKLISYKEEVKIKSKSIERLEHLNAELQQALVETNVEKEKEYSTKSISIFL